MKTIFLYFSLAGLVGSCIPKEGPNCHKSIGVINNSSQDIWVYDTMRCNTTFSEHVPANSSREKVVNAAGQAPDCYEKYINGYKRGTLDVYLFN